MPKALRKAEKEIRIPKGFNAVEVRANTLDEDDRSVEVCWTAGTRVKRYSWDEGYYMEELAVDKKAIRLDRFNAMSLLDTHDNYSMDSRLGTIVPGSVRIEGGKGYARIRFSKKQRAEEILQDLRDGHPLPISVGYKIHRYEKTEGSDGQLPVLRAIDWEPMELSAVPVPADPEAVSRSEPTGGDFETVLVRQDSPNSAAADSNLEKPMNKREAAKTYRGEQLEALALGAGITRKDSETDDALSVRLLAAYDAEDEQVRKDEADAKKRSDDEARRKAEEEQQNRSGGQQQTQQQPVSITPTEVAEQSRAAVASERKRVKEINELARSAGIKDDDEMVRKAIDEGTDLNAFRSAVFDKLVERQAKSQTFPHVETRGMQDAVETTRKLVANALLHRHGVVAKLEDGASEWRSMSALDIAKELLAMRGESTRGSVHDIVARALHTTSDFPMIMGDITRQTLLSGYTGYENTFDLFATRTVLSDFRETKTLELGSAPDLKKVNEHGEFTRGTFRENEEGLKLETYGRVVGLTRHMIINDQLGAFTQAISNWGRKVAKLEGDIVWATILQNIKLKDGNAIFHSSRGNLAGTGTALDQANLEKARTGYRKIKDIDGEAMNISPKYLFVGSNLEIQAQKLISGITVAQTVDQVVPEAIRSLQPVYEHRLDAIATNAWFLFAAKEQTMGRGIHYLHLAGQEQPRTDERVGFDVDGIEYKIAHDFGAGATDWRFGYKNVGVNPT